MFKNNEKNIIFYNLSKNTYRQIFEEELNDNLEELKEGFFDDF